MQISCDDATIIDTRSYIAELQRAVKPTELAERRIAPSAAGLGFNWTALVFFVIALRFLPWYCHPLLLILIAARQHALLILMHDGSHYLLCRNKKWNDLLSDLFCAFPFFISTAGYRAHHLAHHEHLNTDGDPDLQRKTGPGGEPRAWQFPTDPAQLAWLFGRDLLGHGVLDIFRGVRQLSERAAQKETPAPAYPHGRAVRLLHAAVMLAIVIGSGTPGLLLYAWLVPLFFLLPPLIRLRGIAEHFALAATNPLNSSRSVETGWLERFFFAPHNSSLHLDHHLFPYVPWHRLPELHRRLKATQLYKREAHITSGYLVGSKTLVSEVVSSGKGTAH